MGLHFYDVATWKLVSDVLLAGSLIFFAWRFLRSPSLSAQSNRVAELEGALRGLIREADQAGRSLNDSLIKRQGSLEKLLLDLEGLESRVRSTVQDADRTDRKPETPRGRAEAAPAAAPQPAREFDPTPRPVARRTQPAVAPMASRPMPESAPEPAIGAEPEPPSFEELRPAPAPQQIAVQQAAAPQAIAQQAAPQANAARITRRNIYGEAVSAAAAEPAAAAAEVLSSESRPRSAVERYKALARRVEKTVATPAGSAQRAQVISPNPVAQIFRAAEEMIRTGQDLEHVAAETRLPIQQVKVLSQLIERERKTQAEMLEKQAAPAPKALPPVELETPMPPPEAGETPQGDDRLGVLRGIRRQTQVL